jgi:hypothetical protein
VRRPPKSAEPRGAVRYDSDVLLSSAVVAVALVQATQVEAWIATDPVAVPELGSATCADAAGPWIAFVQVFPIPEELRRHHAPRPPWRLVRLGPSGALEVVAEAEAKRGGGWGAPTFVAVAKDGTVTATWRPGHEVLIARPKQKAVLHPVRYDGSRDCVALSTTWILHRDDRSGALHGRRLTADGPGEDVRFGPAPPSGARRITFGAPWLAWIEREGAVAAIDVERGEKRTVPSVAQGRAEIDGVWNGRLFLRESGERARIHVVDLDRAAAHSLPAPHGATWCGPEGVFVDRLFRDSVDPTMVIAERAFWDPVEGPFVPVDPTPTTSRDATVLRRGRGVLWIGGGWPTAEWLELRTQGVPTTRPTPTPVSESRPAPPPLVLPPQPTGEVGDAARAAWRAARER